jgi:hypothetical protein
VTPVALLLPAGEVVVEAFDPALEGLVEALHEVLDSDRVDVVFHPQPSARLRVPAPFVRLDRLPAIPRAEVPDEVVGVQDVPLPVKGVEGDPGPCLRGADPYHGLDHQDGMHGAPLDPEPSLEEGEPVDPLTGVSLRGSSSGPAQECLTPSSTTVLSNRHRPRRP